ncbi:hypothetical protein NKR19_g4805 [Coniochaeta hoffmannii]|uniref:DNase1 protein n=1 Tax=Coniochaeta hoffmannii TaxID=91930 RepID=A0AA38VHQ8_9PEZI|nr:hypothetical protein NKR19_g4805 [Coniochaeta hoffmannii]
MRSFGLFLLGAGVALANTVTFKALDQTTRKIIFTPNTGLEAIPSVEVAPGNDVKVDFPHGWLGNWYAVSEGAPDVPGMLGEVAFNGYADVTYFDVSAIVNPADHQGVNEIYPANDRKPTSGCPNGFPCNNAYYVWDDVQTKATAEKDLICTLGQGSADSKRDVDAHLDEPVFKRDFVMGKWTR